MAAPSMELRPTPAGGDDYLHRGADNLVRLNQSDLLSTLAADGGFILDPTDPVVRCLPNHFVSGICGRVLRPGASIEQQDMVFGDWQLDPAFTLTVLAKMKANGVSFSPCSSAELIRRFSREAARAPVNEYVVEAGNFLATQPFTGAEPRDDIWLNDVSIHSLVDAGGHLSPWADLCLLVGPYYTRDVRQISSNSQFTYALTELARAVCAGDDGLVAPQPRPAVAPVAAVPGVAAVPPQLGAGRGRGRGAVIAAAMPAVPAVPAVPGRPAAVFPSTEHDEDIRLGIADYLQTNALPDELITVPKTRRDVRLELQARQSYSTEVNREKIVRARFAYLLECVPHLKRVVAGAALAAQLDTLHRLALEMLSTPFDVKMVASFHALNDAVKMHVYVLDEDGGDANMPMETRARKVLDAFQSAVHRRAAAPTAVDASGAGHASAVGAVSGGASGAPAFAKGNFDALRTFVAAHQVDFINSLKAPDPGHALSPFAANDSVRILGKCFKPKWGVVFLQLIPHEQDLSNFEMFAIVNPHKHMLYTYMSEAVFKNDDNTVDKACQGDILSHAFVDDFLAGRRWAELDMYKELVRRLKDHKGTIDTVPVDERWPLGIFGSKVAMRELLPRIDNLFHAIGYRQRSATGVFNAFNRMLKYLEDYDDASFYPAKSLYDIYSTFMNEARGFFISAKRSNADGRFPIFRIDDPLWLTTMNELVDTAVKLAAQRKLLQQSQQTQRRLGANVSFVDMTAQQQQPGAGYGGNFMNVHPDFIDGRKRPASPSSSVASADDGRRARPNALAVGGAQAAESPWKANPGLGEWKHRVLVLNDNLCRVSFPSDKKGDNVWDFKVQPIKKHLRRAEGSDSKCIPVAVCRHKSRIAFCPTPNAPGHGPNGDAHTFTTRPWESFGTTEFSSRHN